MRGYGNGRYDVFVRRTVHVSEPESLDLEFTDVPEKMQEFEEIGRVVEVEPDVVYLQALQGARRRDEFGYVENIRDPQIIQREVPEAG